MKNNNAILFFVGWILFSLPLVISCAGDDPIPDDSGKDNGGGNEVITVSPVNDLAVEETGKANELYVTWTYPSEALSVEISYLPEGEDEAGAVNNNIRRTTGDKGSFLIKVSEHGTYIVGAVAIDNYGNRSEKVTVKATPMREEDVPKTLFLERADMLMSSLIDLCFGKSPRDCWNTRYPNATGPYWDGDAVVWGQGSGLSGFVALRNAAIGTEYEAKYTAMTDRMYNSINRFITTDNNLNAYAVYPQNGNQRFYDDNVWIGLDMAELYRQTGESRFLEKAEMVWDYLMVGNTSSAGGGILWREIPAYSNKHTCSTAPAAVLGCKLYEITKEEKYLNKAKELYAWLKQYLQDPSDHLFYDNITPGMVVDKAKYSYNSGQPMQAACLLYNITGEQKYLEDAAQIAISAHRRWFSLYNSKELGEEFYRINGDHAWFFAIMFRGFIELYKIDKRRTYINSFEKSMLQAWESECRDRATNLLSNRYFVNQTQTSWEVLHEGGFVEMLAQLAALEKEGL
jgi:rhamnogalacturonyl hydrolase YesR